MLRLRNAYESRRAAVILGGPSLMARQALLASLRKQGFVVFAETKALTPWLLDIGVEPDFLLMPFPEKAQDNALQHFVSRALYSGFSAEPLLRKPFKPVAKEIKNNFDSHFELWKPHKGVHKRFRMRAGVYLKDSPYDLLKRIPSTRIITNAQNLEAIFPDHDYPNPVYDFAQSEPSDVFDVQRYYQPQAINGRLTVEGNNFLNSAAIALYPLLHFMGFSECYLLGMDMSMLGSLEYAACFSFTSMLHYRYFFIRAQRAFNAAYKPNKPFYLRPKSEFEDLRQTLTGSGQTRFIRVHEPWKYAADVSDLPVASFDDFAAIDARQKELVA